MRHHHIGEDHVRGLLFEQGERRLAAVGFQADEPQGFAHGHAETADALLVIDNQKTDSKVFVTVLSPWSARPRK